MQPLPDVSPTSTSTQPLPDVSPISVPAQTGTLLFRDDFQDGQAQDWSINSAWNVEQFGDVYLFRASGLGGAWVTNGGGWTDYTYQSAFRVNAGTLLVSINLSQSGRYGLHLGGDGVYLFEEQPAGTFNILGEAGPITTGNWHTVLFASQDGHVQVTIDQVVWFDVTDPTPVMQGTIAVSALEGSRVGVDNVLVTKIQGTLAAGIPQAPAPVSSVPVQVEDIQEELDSLTAAEVDTVVEEELPPPPPVVGGMPDLVVEDVSFTPSPILQGQPFTANYLVTNQGDAAAGAFTFSLHYHASAGIADCNMDVMGLAPGEVAWGGCVRTINGEAGNYPIEATVDVEGEITESDEGNNMTSSTITVEAPPLPANQADLVITSVEKADANRINCAVQNIGMGDAPAEIPIELYINGNRQQQAKIGPDLPAGASFDAALPYDPNNPPAHPYEATCIIDPTNIVAESNEGNNELTVTIP